MSILVREYGQNHYRTYEGVTSGRKIWDRVQQAILNGSTKGAYIWETHSHIHISGIIFVTLDDLRSRNEKRQQYQDHPNAWTINCGMCYMTKKDILMSENSVSNAKEPSPFNIGDEVRLNKGWTRLVVIGFTDDGNLIAKYDHDKLSPFYRVTEDSFKEPQFASGTQKRKPSGFTKWDGEQPKKVYYKMTKTYRAISGPYTGQTGTFLNTTSDGALVLEMVNGEVCVFDPSKLKEVVPFTFRVKAVANNYRCSYESPQSITIREGDLLLSKSGNLYCVTDLNTKETNTKGIFKGTRLIQEELQ